MSWHLNVEIRIFNWVASPWRQSLPSKLRLSRSSGCTDALQRKRYNLQSRNCYSCREFVRRRCLRGNKTQSIKRYRQSYHNDVKSEGIEVAAIKECWDWRVSKSDDFLHYFGRMAMLPKTIEHIVIALEDIGEEFLHSERLPMHGTQVADLKRPLTILHSHLMIS